MARLCAALLVAIGAVAGCASSPPEPEPAAPASTPPLPAPTPIALPPEPPTAVRERQRALDDLGRALDELEPTIGEWPPTVSSENERHEVFARWRAALERARPLDVPGTQDPVVLWLVASTYRQGHNLDVKGADAMAAARFEQCLVLDPDFVECHRGLGRLYLASKPELAPAAEKHLRRAHDLYAPSVHPDLERQIALAMLKQGRTADAVAYLDAYLADQPGDERTRELRGWIAEGKLQRLVVE